jgi:hypothetical protein
MTLPSFITEKSVDSVVKAGGAVVALLIGGFLWYNQMAYQTQKLDAMAPTVEVLKQGNAELKASQEQIMQDHVLMRQELSSGIQEMIEVLRKNCVNTARTTQAASNCLK